MSKLPEIVGLTGSMGAGKSAAGSILRKSYPVLDCDQLNRELLEPGQAGFEALLKAGLLPVKDGQADRQALADAMFSDPAVRRQVEAILHPLILQAMEDWKKEQSGLAFVEVPLLFEAGLQGLFDEVWCVIADQPVALERLEQGRGVDHTEALRRWKNQLDPQTKAAASHYVIENNGSLAELEAQLKKGVERIESERSLPD